MDILRTEGLFKTYNEGSENEVHALKPLDISIEEVHDYLLNHLRFGGFLGTKPTHIKAYLESFGFKIKRVFRKKKALELSKTINSGIIMYFHNRGAHFVAFYRENEEDFRFLNAIYGRESHILTMEEFLRDHSYFNLMYFMGVE